MSCVVDASVIVKWVLREEDSDAALALRGEVLLAPSLWCAEVANAIWRRVARNELAAAEAAAILAEARNAELRSVGIDELVEAALELAMALHHPVYDCLYLALALREDCHVITADRRFAALAQSRPDLKGRIRLLA